MCQQRRFASLLHLYKTALDAMLTAFLS